MSRKIVRNSSQAGSPSAYISKIHAHFLVEYSGHTNHTKNDWTSICPFRSANLFPEELSWCGARKIKGLRKWGESRAPHEASTSQVPASSNVLVSCTYALPLPHGQGLAPATCREQATVELKSHKSFLILSAAPRLMEPI